MCDEDAARNINEDENLRWRFMNFVNQSDPVPCLLDSIVHTVGVVRTSLTSNENVREFPLEGFGSVLARGIDAYASGGFLQGACAALIATFDIGMSQIASTSNTIFAQHLLGLLAQRAAPRPGTSNYHQPDFYPIGYYIFIERQSDEWRDGDRPRFNWHRRDDQSADMRRKLGDMRFGFQDLEHHKLRSYKLVLINSNLMDSPHVPSTEYQRNNVVSTPTPIVSTI